MAAYNAKKEEERKKRIEKIKENLSLEGLNSLVPPESMSCASDGLNPEELVKGEMASFAASVSK